MDWINNVATILSILGLSLSGAIIALYQWFKRNAVIVGIQDPRSPVTKPRLSFEDVRQGLEILVEDAGRYNADFIYGINRGGAIVGGCLAKKLRKNELYTLTVNCDLPIDQRVLEHNPATQSISGRVLLVDDAIRKGEHMREAQDYLAKKYPGIVIRRIVLLEMQVPHSGPESKTFRATPVERAAFITYDSRVVLPWDP